MGRFEELLLIAVVALLLFGPNKVTDLAKGLGGFMREFKKAANPEEETKAPAQPAAASLPETKAAETKNPTA
jgi:sec-independent protein translocase protein TatA